jgi:hypothetical protein
MFKTLLASFVLFATSALAADFTGNWSGEGVASGQSHSLFFILKQDGNSVTGSGGPNAEEQHPFKSATLDGDKIILEVGIGKGTLHFELKPDGETLKGTVELRREDGTESGTVLLKKAVV